MIGTEANSSATLGLALFSGCDILKSSMVRHSSPLLLLRVPRPDLLGQDGACQYSGLYIHTNKSFVINQYLYIQNRKPRVISKSMSIPREGVSLTSSPYANGIAICIYVPRSPLSSTNICIYRTATHLLSANRCYAHRGWCTRRQTARNPPANPARTYQPNQPQPAPNCARAPRGIIRTSTEKKSKPRIQPSATRPSPTSPAAASSATPPRPVA
jgi:hypothetical protein